MEVKALSDDFGYQSKVTLELTYKDSRILQIATGCLAQHSYIIVNQTICMVIDPMRESEPYMSYIKKHCLTLTNILMTHVHADFVSGHLQLQKDYMSYKGICAVINYGGGNMSYDIQRVLDGEEMSLGQGVVKVIHTPGHTLESVCYLLDDKVLFTGDTLFLGDVGRPDLAQTVDQNLSKEKMAGMLFNSLAKLKQLNDDTVVLTGHGSGSACGKNIQGGTHSTMGAQKDTNYALADTMTQECLIETLCTNVAAPQNWFNNVIKQNCQGYPSLEEIWNRCDHNLDINNIDESIRLVDCRPRQQVLESGYIPRCVGVYYESSVAQFVGQLFNSHEQFVLIANQAHRHELVARFTRIGYNNIIGFVGNLDEYKESLSVLNEISGQEMAVVLGENEKIKVLDVRKQNEYNTQHVTGSYLLPMDRVSQSAEESEIELSKEFREEEIVYVMCRSGMRSLMAITMMSKMDWAKGKKLVSVRGGIMGLEKEGVVMVTE